MKNHAPGFRQCAIVQAPVSVGALPSIPDRGGARVLAMLANRRDCTVRAIDGGQRWVVGGGAGDGGMVRVLDAATGRVETAQRPGERHPRLHETFTCPPGLTLEVTPEHPGGVIVQRLLDGGAERRWDIAVRKELRPLRNAEQKIIESEQVAWERRPYLCACSPSLWGGGGGRERLTFGGVTECTRWSIFREHTCPPDDYYSLH